MADVVAESAERQWPPTPPAWIDDRASQRCTGRSCHVVFDGLVERRHHCRFCGNLFCHRCSARKAMLPPQWAIKEPQRTCDTCYSILAPEQEGYHATAGDVVEPGTMRWRGNAIHMNYVLEVPYGDGTLDVRMDDWMYLITPDTLINETTMSKWGIEVGEVVLVIQKK